MWQLKGMSITVNCCKEDPQRARRQLIYEYNRKPSVYVENDPIKTCLRIPGRVVDFFNDLFQKPLDVEAVATQPREQGETSDNLAAGAPRSAVCDNLDVSVYKVLQRAICYAGAGLGIVGIGMVSFFALFTAAGAACAVITCNKLADQQCQEVYDPCDSEAYYEGQTIMTAQNNYQPGSITDRAPMQHHRYHPPYLM
ncbi:uncharacterized protein BXIN_2796 [Babesia sp. Xinjiang]|uniref:uncharacterized protein n=1 Tax=Babesia sp. Xinjiang TaxID=462227 RepID=UPI000A234A98|nr:uncharacterized protein BXIN_2796 [Babesia sp. Xinjiang]ORM41677.1 hypothetical protein BXIN_2796 [Babesia sp. Xinjiang]